MALPHLSHFKPPSNPLLHPFPLKILNPNPNLCFTSSSLKAKMKMKMKKPFCTTLRCSVTQGDYVQNERSLYPRPQEIQWSKELANSVHLIGTIGTPAQIKQLSSGKVVAWTRLAIKKSVSETSWINLTFWDELAQIAFTHVEKGQQVYVSGRLVSDTVEGEDEKPQVYYKVVVQKLNFIERSYPAVYNEANSTSSGRRTGNYAGNSSGSTEELWQAFFSNPVDWWDNRGNKRNPKYPDFKHKDTGEALWIEGKFNPPWVKSQLAILDTRLASMQANENISGSFVNGDDFTSFS